MGSNMKLLNEHKQKCYQRLQNATAPDDGYKYCDAVWDGWGCWDFTRAGTTATISCPSHKIGFSSSLSATKICTDAGTWFVAPVNNKTWSNYTSCIHQDELQDEYIIVYTHIIGYTFTVLCSILALFIFTYFKQLKCDRIRIHQNLFVAYVLSGIIWICYYLVVTFNGDVMQANPVWCQLLYLTSQFLTCTIYFWMLCEGFYLHTVVVFAFTNGRTLFRCCVIIGWVVPVVIVSNYAVIRYNFSNTSMCWNVEGLLVGWFIMGPIISTLILNTIFLCNIVRVLMGKMRAVNSPSTQKMKTAVRATLILIPLLGSYFIPVIYIPDDSSPAFRYYNRLAAAFLISFQGSFVAMIFCFFNGEVISLMKRMLTRRRLMSSSRGAGQSSSTANGQAVRTFYTQSVSLIDTTNVVGQPLTAPNTPRVSPLPRKSQGHRIVGGKANGRCNNNSDDCSNVKPLLNNSGAKKVDTENGNCRENQACL